MNPIIDWVDDAAGRLVEPGASDDALGRGEGAQSCAGIPTDQRLPLEDELSDDNDGVESSWRHFLNLASAAATEADMLGEAVVQNGLEIERRVEIAAADIESICGGAVDIDFLVGISDANPPSNLCQGVTDGETRRGFNAGYVCRGGVAMPDALETTRVRAEGGDAGALALLDCIGEDSRVRWASLGSRPLCLWEEVSGQACVGAREAGADCPQIRIGSDCGAQLASAIERVTTVLGLEVAPVAVTVTANLGIFADTIASVPPSTGTNGTGLGADELPCDDLRTLRSASGDRDGARRRLLESPWLSLAEVSRVASMLSWQALPLDYGKVIRDDTRWVYTGDPVHGEYGSTWPCGRPIDDRLSAAARECAGDPNYGTSMAGSLGCSFVADCRVSGTTPAGTTVDSVADLRDRIRMNHRLGRSVLALRLLTAQGLSDMRLPINLTQVQDHGGSVERVQMSGPNDFVFGLGALYRNASGGPLAFTMDSDRILSNLNAQASGGATWTDTTRNNSSSRRSGAAYCVEQLPCDIDDSGCTLEACLSGNGEYPTATGGCDVANAGYLWTYLSPDAYANPELCTDECLRNNDCTDCIRVFAPCDDNNAWRAVDHRRGPFAVWGPSSTEAVAPSNAANFVFTRIWNGVGPQAPIDSQYGLIRQTFDHFEAGRPGSEQVPFDEGTYGGDYWTNGGGSRTSNIRMLEQLTYDDVMDGLELACASARSERQEAGTAVGGVSDDICSPSRLARYGASTELDLEQMREFLTCSADLIETDAERMVVRNVPGELVATVQSEFGGATLPVLQGERGVLIGELTAELISIRTYRIQLASILRDLGEQIHLLKNELASYNIQKEQVGIQLSSTIANQITACVAASSPTTSASGLKYPLIFKSPYFEGTWQSTESDACDRRMST